jgi:pimeloyl-ACP methyl ester carboxylesterase
LTCHLGYWLRVVPLLEGFRVVALDFRGHGLSAHRDSYRYAEYERDLFALLDLLGLERVTVAGHSLGGYVALFAASHSGRLGRVIAIDVKSDWTEEDVTLAERSRSGSQRVEVDRDLLLERLAWGVAPAVLTSEELEVLAERSIEPVEGGWRPRWDRRVLDPEPVAPFAFLARIRCPVHVMAGSRSEVMPAAKARSFAEAIPAGTHELVDDAGHHVELDAPELVAKRIVDLAQC